MTSQRTINEVARLGGKARSERKAISSRTNAIKAREMKLLYRTNPTLRKVKSNGNPRPSSR